MSTINSVGNNGNSIYEKLKINKTEKTEKKEETIVELSKTAQEYLKQLKQKYGMQYKIKKDWLNYLCQLKGVNNG